MKCSIEYSEVRNGRKYLPHLTNAIDNHRIMQRRERIELLQLREELISEQCRLSECLATVNNTMRNNTHLACALDDAGFLRSEFRHHCLERGCMIAFP